MLRSANLISMIIIIIQDERRDRRGGVFLGGGTSVGLLEGYISGAPAPWSAVLVFDGSLNPGFRFLGRMTWLAIDGWI